jgi:hypothetical protein
MSSIARVFAPRSVTILVFKREDNELDVIWADVGPKLTFSRVRDTSHIAQGRARRPQVRGDRGMIAKVL